MLENLLSSPDIPKKELLLKRNEFLIREGDLNTNLYFIKEGAILAYVMEEEEEQIIRFGYKNDFISAIDSFISGKPTQFFFKAVKKTFLIQISKSSLIKMISGNIELMSEWAELLQKLSLQQLERERDLLTSSPKARYERVLKRSPQLFQEIPHRYIANYLRMSPETLSRLKNS